MKRKVFVILTAAGTGSRFSDRGRTATPKQFIRLQNRPVIIHSLIEFQRNKYIDEIFVALRKENFELLRKLAARFRLTKLKELVEGGNTRYRSVRNAFERIRAEKNDLVMIHDGARPNMGKALLGRLLSDAFRFGEVIPGIRAGDTVKKVDGNFVKGTLERESLWLVQTPQVFRYGTLMKAYAAADSKKFNIKKFTDESSIVEQAGFKVRITEGSGNNIKITTSGDLKLLEKIMQQ